MYTGAIGTLGTVCTLGQCVYWGTLSSGAGLTLDHKGSCVIVYTWAVCTLSLCTRAVDVMPMLSIHFYAGVMCTFEW